MMKFLVIGVLVAVAGALGYFGERFVRPAGPPEPAMAAAVDHKSELLFKMPMGHFTMQVMQPSGTTHVVFDLDLYVMGEAAFEKINGAVGKAKLRDATVAAIAELAETDQRLLQPVEDAEIREMFSDQVVRKLYVNFPEIRAARINSFNANETPRD